MLLAIVVLLCVAATAVNSATDAAQRLGDICSGVVEIPDEA